MPTLEETGVASFESFDLACGCRAAFKLRLRSSNISIQQINEVLALPEVKEQFAKIAVEPVGGSIAETTKFLAAERDKWRTVVKSANISVE